VKRLIEIMYFLFYPTNNGTPVYVLSPCLSVTVLQGLPTYFGHGLLWGKETIWEANNL